MSNQKACRIVCGSLSLLVWGCSRNAEDVLLHVAGKVSLGSLSNKLIDLKTSLTNQLENDRVGKKQNKMPGLNTMQ